MKVTIGALAKMAGCPVVTIRFYEKEGLLEPAERSGKNYRLYGQAQLERLRFILHCRKHGITLAEIRKLLAFMDHPEWECGYVHDLVRTHLAYVEEQIASLRALKDKLGILYRKGDCKSQGNCSILRQLGDSDDCRYCSDLRELELKK